MKMTCLALLVAGVLGSGAAFAQTCGAPGSWNPDSTGAPPVTTDLCAGSDSVALFCQFLDSSGKNDGIYQITLAAGFTATSISVNGGTATFNPVTYLYSDACTTANACVQSGDAGTPLPLTGTTPGTYFLAVTAAASDGAGACGQPQMSTDGTFPVSLQNFSVE